MRNGKNARNTKNAYVAPPTLRKKLDRGIWSKSNDLRDCLVVFSKKSDPLTWFILRALYVIHIDTAPIVHVFVARCRYDVGNVTSSCPNLSHFFAPRASWPF